MEISQRGETGWTSLEMSKVLNVPHDRYRKYEQRTPIPTYLMERFALVAEGMKAKVSRFCHRLGIVFAGAWFVFFFAVFALDGENAFQALVQEPVFLVIGLALYGGTRIIGWVVNALLD